MLCLKSSWALTLLWSNICPLSLVTPPPAHHVTQQRLYSHNFLSWYKVGVVKCEMMGTGISLGGRMKRRRYSWLASLRWVKMVDLEDLWDIHTQDYSPSPANRVPLVGSTTPPIIIQMHCIALMSRTTHPPTTQSNVHCNMLIKQNNDKNLMQTMKIEICWFAEKSHLKVT